MGQEVFLGAGTYMGTWWHLYLPGWVKFKDTTGWSPGSAFASGTTVVRTLQTQVAVNWLCDSYSS